MRPTIQQSGRNVQIIRGRNNLNGLALAHLGLGFYGLGLGFGNNNDISINFAEETCCRRYEPILHENMMIEEEIF